MRFSAISSSSSFDLFCIGIGGFLFALGGTAAGLAPFVWVRANIRQPEDMCPLAPAGVAPFVAGLAIEGGFQFPDRCLRRLSQGAQRDQGHPVTPIALGLQQVKPAVYRLANRGLRLGSPGEGIAGPPAKMIVFQDSHSNRSASRTLASGALRIRTDTRKQDSWLPWAYRMPLAGALRSPPDRGI
jgi:hypothetical protein